MREHPAAFEFDAMYTRSLTDINRAVRDLSPTEYGVVVIDSVTHLWEAAIAAYAGRVTSVGSIPFQAWAKIKSPYKALMAYLLSSPLHMIICGRQKTVYATNEETEELEAVGVAMRAEGETPYEPHVLIRMESLRPMKTQQVGSVIAYAEKDRTGVLSGRSFVNPTFEALGKPLLPLLGRTQAQIPTSEETAATDAEALTMADAERVRISAETLREWSARIELAENAQQLKSLGKLITPTLKATMVPADVAALREVYQARETAVSRPSRKAVDGENSNDDDA
jgi:hypothetical protein